ncbi:unnamed protein product [Cylicocyclus nassatus]|uniref:Uncharacterized protein n=1 Tax=Cylicocyclus nassatus TaxID=53992 RepID=A0AA36MDH9_CYLNA|nr:unnamed protein product [Cylicocyclus nassatus]
MNVTTKSKSHVQVATEDMMCSSGYKQEDFELLTKLSKIYQNFNIVWSCLQDFCQHISCLVLSFKPKTI